MRLLRVAVLLVAGLVFAGCGALTGDGGSGLTGLGLGDVAARSGEAVVTTDELAAQVQATLDAGALEGGEDGGDQVDQQLQLQTQVLNNLLLVELATTAAADEFDIDVTADNLDSLVEGAIANAGGREAFEEQLAASGQNLRLYRRTQEIVMLRQQVTEALLAEEPVSDGEVRAAYQQNIDQFEGTPEDEALEQVRAQLEAQRGEQAFSEWFRRIAEEAEPEVASRFGRWDAEQLSVVDGDPSGAPTPQQ